LLCLQQLYLKILALNLHHMFFISLSNNLEYFSKQKFNRYLNYYPYYLLILLGLQQFIVSVDFFLQIFFYKILLYTHLIRLQTEYLNFYANSTTLNNLL